MGETYALEKTNANRVISITQSTINELNAALSKTGKSILLTLYQNPRIQQKVLAANINTSAASLSNLLSKLEVIRPALLNIEPEGRSKYYSLTRIAEQYVCSELMPKGTYHINTSFAAPADTSLYHHPLLPLFELEKQNPKKAIELINYIFAEMKPQIFEKDELSLFPNNDLPVSEEEYLAIFHRLTMMANEFFSHREPKLQILKKWEKTFSTTNITLYFIAEKCNTINLLESRIHSQR